MQNIWSLAHVVFMGTVVCHQLWIVLAFFLLHSSGCAVCVFQHVANPEFRKQNLIRSRCNILKPEGMFLTDLFLCQISICQFSNFGCCYFSLEIAVFMLPSRQADKQKLCGFTRVWLFERQQYDTAW